MKYKTFFKRCATRFALKVQETIAKGKQPNLRNYASQYRDADPELVWRMCCLWVEAQAAIQARCHHQRARGLTALEGSPCFLHQCTFGNATLVCSSSTWMYH